MTRKRADSFRIALESLRGELRAGVHPAGARLTANDIAARLALSPTPVREALSRLAGEGLLQDRRGQGFFVPRLQERDIVALFRLQRDLLLMTCDGAWMAAGGVEGLATPTRAETPADAEPSDERHMRVLAASHSPALVRHLARLQDQLASVRAVEAHVLDAAPDPEAELIARAMSAGDAVGLQRELRAFFDRRIAAAPRLARLIDARRSIESI